MKVMKRSISITLLIVLLLCGCQNTVFAASIQLPANLRVIEAEAFYGDRSIIEVIVPDGAVSIGARAFASTGLQRIVIPDSVTTIAENAFDGINKLIIVSSSGSYAQQYASQYSWIIWENSKYVSTITVNSPLTRDNVLDLLDDIDPDGAFIIRNTSESLFMNWFGSAATIGEGFNTLSTAVHEQCHDYCSTPYGIRYNSVQRKYMREKEWIYIGNGQHIVVTSTDVFPSSEMIDTIPESLRTFRFDTYINGDPSMASIQYGVYGMLDEFTAYCWGIKNDIAQKEFRKKNHLTIWNSNTFLAYAEFRYYILHYMLYAKENYPNVYQGILNNSNFRYAFTTIDNLFASFAEEQKNNYSINDWNALMNEMRKTDYVNMANLLKN